MPEPLKNVYNKAYITRLASALKEAGVELEEENFLRLIFDSRWDERELKERTTHIRACMKEVLPPSFPEAIPFLLKAGESFGGYEGMFFPEYVQAYGLDYWDESLMALEVLTQYSSAEFAIRPFLEMNPIKGMEKMEAWSLHENDHVRRLSSEGCRPLLPWASQLKIFREDPNPLFKILENLKSDQSLYVRKSVANNLNDISKDHPELALKKAKEWIQNNSPETRWIVKHGLRTLLKSGEKKALSLFGYGSEQSFEAKDLLLKTPLVILGDNLEFEFDLLVKKKAAFRFEYALHFLKKNGTYTKKVFKISEQDLEPGEYEVDKSHAIKKINTRVYYEGLHFLEVIVNGVSVSKIPFVLWLDSTPYMTYMLLTESGTIYTGVTTDFNRRYEEHSGRAKGNKGAKYTKANAPKYLIYLEKSDNRSEAQKRESALKKLTRKQKEAISWLKNLK